MGDTSLGSPLLCDPCLRTWPGSAGHSDVVLGTVWGSF